MLAVQLVVGRAVVAAGAQNGDLRGGSGLEPVTQVLQQVVVAGLLGLLGEAVLARAEAEADDVRTALGREVLDRVHHLGQALGALGLRDTRLDQLDLRAGRHGVRVLDVERGLAGPAGHVVVLGIERRDLAPLLHVDLGGRQAVLLVEHVQVVLDRRGTEGVHDRDRFAAPVDLLVKERAGVVRGLVLRGAVAVRAELLAALGSGQRLLPGRREDVPRRRRLRHHRVGRRGAGRAGDRQNGGGDGECGGGGEGYAARTARGRRGHTGFPLRRARPRAGRDRIGEAAGHTAAVGLEPDPSRRFRRPEFRPSSSTWGGFAMCSSSRNAPLTPAVFRLDALV